MADNDTFLRFLAAWALVHETADEGWKAAVTRGAGQDAGRMDATSGAFVDGLSALVAEEKERLKAELASGERGGAASERELGDHLDALRFEISELRGRIESLQASVDALGPQGPDGDGRP
jgi:hypothetical protein